MIRNNNSFAPENYILLGTPLTRQSDIESIVHNAKTQHPEQFAGKKDSFAFELRYTESFDKNFMELKRLQGTAAEVAGRRDEFRGYIVINLSSYLNHYEEDYLKKLILFLIDMSDCWKYIFIVDDQNARSARELVGKVLTFFIHDNLRCSVSEKKEKTPVGDPVSEICRECGITCTLQVKRILRRMLDQNFSSELITALLTEMSWYSDKCINKDMLENFLSGSDSMLRYMLTQKEFNRLMSFFKCRKESRDGEKEAI
ncbi:hypothetical protein [uncultured Eubacterium sp.]|uniref:hypothetical protein n=1 Tax=uncultured Eubacterium sp. TaxID=165185 RepID=UPI0025F74918|nr:hypothetical protein [uncultured Eubacterium sp.]